MMATMLVCGWISGMFPPHDIVHDLLYNSAQRRSSLWSYPVTAGKLTQPPLPVLSVLIAPAPKKNLLRRVSWLKASTTFSGYAAFHNAGTD